METSHNISFAAVKLLITHHHHHRIVRHCWLRRDLGLSNRHRGTKERILGGVLSGVGGGELSGSGVGGKWGGVGGELSSGGVRGRG